ncbi:MAG: CbiX/SirB N-terminal domain-containing protein [Dehalococcoidia bacterium]|jgi:sirohydrochlorin cobaltochelatase
MTALVLVGHGSHLNANSSAPVRSLAAEMRRRGGFDEVRTGYWKEEPSLARCLDGCEDPDIVVVPVFISNGYFTKTVIPREMRLDGPLTLRDGQAIRYTPPVGADPSLAEIVIERARETGATADDAIAVLGHGTRRDSESERNILAMASRVRASGQFAEAGAVFLDQEPDMRGLLDEFSARTIVVVPFFIADGWHVGQTIPADLALDGEETRRGGRIVRYARPVGTHPAVAGVVASLARPS